MAVAANLPVAIAGYAMVNSLIGRLDQVVSNAGAQGNMVVVQGGRIIASDNLSYVILSALARSFRGGRWQT